MSEEEKRVLELLNMANVIMGCILDDKQANIILNLIDKLQKENQELKEKNTILEGNKIGYKLAIQELKEKIKEYEIGMLKE